VVRRKTYWFHRQAINEALQLSDRKTTHFFKHEISDLRDAAARPAIRVLHRQPRSRSVPGNAVGHWPSCSITSDKRMPRVAAKLKCQH
jgi:hypothetical protein